MRLPASRDDTVAGNGDAARLQPFLQLGLRVLAPGREIGRLDDLAEEAPHDGVRRIEAAVLEGRADERLERVGKDRRALRAAAARLGTTRLPGCDLLVTLEPCPMCAQAASFFRIRRLVFGAYDPKGGGIEHGARVFDAPSCHHRPEVIGGVREADGAALLSAFFAAQRRRASPRSGRETR